MSDSKSVLEVMDIVAEHTFEGRAAALREARATVAELLEAVSERMKLSRAGRKPSGPFAASDARIDAALLRAGGSP